MVNNIAVASRESIVAAIKNFGAYCAIEEVVAGLAAASGRSIGEITQIVNIVEAERSLREHEAVREKHCRDRLRAAELLTATAKEVA